MKTKLTLKLATAFAVLMLCLSCSDEPEMKLPKQPKEVQFSFSIPAAALEAGRSSAIPNGSRLLISVNTIWGQNLFTLRPVSILKMGDSYITEPLFLDPGEYKITDFFVADNTEVLFATPRSSSSLGKHVATSLPLSFSIPDEGGANVEMDVISTEGLASYEFGYAEFFINVVDPFAVKLTTKKRQGRIRFQLGVRSVGTLFVNWGDGHIDTLNFEPDEEIEIPSSSSLIKPEHYYATLGFHEITITGDVYRILSFDNKGADLSAVDVRDAKSLISISLNDLSLQQLNLSGLGVSYLYFTDIEIANFNITGCDDVRELELSGNVSPATSDQIIQKLHSVTTTYNVTNGLVETHGLNPTLSTTASALVQDLQATYDWTYWLYP